MMDIKEFKNFFDEQFIALLEEKSATFNSYSDTTEVQEIIFHINALAQQGKRFRPYMAHCGYVSEGGDQDIFPLLAAIELIHFFCLVQDDVIDDADVRRGMTTMNEKFGNDIAMLAGDVLAAWAYECLSDLEAVEPYTVDDVRKEFAELVSEVIHGQMLDVLQTDAKNLPRNAIEQNMKLKSARYSFYHPLYCGMLLAGCDDEAKDFAEDYATNVGMAFQLLDDIADCSLDLQAKKQTLISWYLDTNPSKNFADAISFAEEAADEYVAGASDALFTYNRSNEPVWEEILDEVRQAFL